MLALASVTCVRYFQKRALTRLLLRDILGLFRLPDLGAIKWFQIELWPPIAPH
jgi:hypothetical protein